jgi:3-oxoacyl-[acyl-carrier-protein] synthase II
MMMPSHRRVVVTGMGAITPLGNSLVTSWKALLANESGMTTLEEALKHQDLPDEGLSRELEAAQALTCQVAAPVKGIQRDARTNRFIQFALHAGAEAMTQSGLQEYLSESGTNDRVGVCMGSGMSSVREVVEAARTVEQKGLRRLSPHFVPKVLTNSAAGRLSLEYQLRGPNHAASTACAAGAHAIGDAMRCIQYGDADVMLAGGAEACIDPLSMAGFSRLRALSSQSDPHTASRPFDVDRDGFVMGEGSAVLVLEEFEHAQRRGAPILAELIGYGLTGDAYHITSPEPSGSGASRAMSMALERAGISNVGYINAHATSTPMGDDTEALAINRTFASGNAGSSTSDEPQQELLVSSTKGATGHLLGAAGAVEACFTIQALRNKIIPPTRNLNAVNDEGEQQHFSHVREVTKKEDLDVAMTNSFGFGGTNASLIFQMPSS